MKHKIPTVLNKIPSFQERAYQAHIENEKIRIMRIMCGLGIFLYFVFSVVDYWALPSIFDKALLIRGIFVVLLAVFYFITFTKVFIKFYDLLVPIPYLVGAIGIEAMIFLANPGEIASKNYFAGLMLIIMILFSWSHLKKINLFVITTVILSMYIGGMVMFRVTSTSEFLPNLISNLFFLIGSVIIGLVTHLVRDGYLQQNFLLQQSLQESLKQKTKESDDHAYQANHDPLTALPNRRYMTQLLEESLQIAKEKDKILAILFFDLNGFKPINDIYGHAAGDEVLIIVAKRLELAIRKGDHISRLGGDEFLVGLMIDKEHASDVNVMAAKFAAIISEPMNVDGNLVKVGASVGISAYPMNGNNVNALIEIADKKMYKLKKGMQKNIKEREKNREPEPVVIFPGNAKNRR